MESKNNIKSIDTNVSNERRKYLDMFSEPEVTAYDFMCLFSATCASQEKYIFDRDQLLAFIKSCKLNGQHSVLLQDINIKSNGVFDCSENYDEAIAKLKWAKILYTVSPEQDASIHIFEDTPCDELIKPRIQYADEMAQFVDNFHEYGTRGQAKAINVK